MSLGKFGKLTRFVGLVFSSGYIAACGGAAPQPPAMPDTAAPADAEAALAEDGEAMPAKKGSCGGKGGDNAGSCGGKGGDKAGSCGGKKGSCGAKSDPEEAPKPEATGKSKPDATIAAPAGAKKGHMVKKKPAKKGGSCGAGSCGSR